MVLGMWCRHMPVQDHTAPALPQGASRKQAGHLDEQAEGEAGVRGARRGHQRAQAGRAPPPPQTPRPAAHSALSGVFVGFLSPLNPSPVPEAATSERSWLRSNSSTKSSPSSPPLHCHGRVCFHPRPCP